MAKVKANLVKQPPTIVIQLLDNGATVELLAWQHAVPMRHLDGLDLRIQQAIHQWRSRFVRGDSGDKVGAETNTQLSDREHKTLLERSSA